MIYKRAIFDQIAEFIHTDDIIVLHGARQVGKTSILSYLQDFLKEQKEITHYIDLEDSRYVRILDQGVESLISYLEEQGFSLANFEIKQKKLYFFIDEIQYLEAPSSLLKLIHDHYKNIKLIVSGSSSFDIKNKFKDSLAGRTVNFEIFPLSFTEYLLFKDYFFDQNKVFTPKKIEELRSLFTEFVLYGGYPKIVLTKELNKKEYYLQQIIDTYVRKDIRDLADIKNIDKFNKLIEVLAEQSGNLLNIQELSNTCNIAKATVEHYLFLLENTYVVRLVSPFSSNLRSELFKVPKIYFYDTGIMQMLWLKGLPKKILGNVFETAIFSELVKKYHRNNVFYWRTSAQHEIDFILRIKGALLPIEVKLNFENFKFSSLNYFIKKYKVTDYKVTALDGRQREKFFLYPWQL